MATFEEYVEKRVVPVIKYWGWTVQGKCAEHTEDAPFAYTVGLSMPFLSNIEPSRPELIVFGFDIDLAIDTFLGLARLDKQSPLQHGDTVHDILNYPLKLIEVVDTSRLRAAEMLFPNMRALQVVWTDIEGRFPWEEGFDVGLPPGEEVPLLGPAPV